MAAIKKFDYVNKVFLKVPQTPSSSGDKKGSETKDDLVIVKHPLLAKERKTMGRRRKGVGSKVAVPNLPPTLSTVTTTDQTLRFVVTAGVSGQISNTELLFAMGSMAITTTSVFTLHSTFRIRRITVWPAQNGSTASAPEVVWFGGGSSAVVKDNQHNSAIPEGVTMAGTPVTSVPPRDTFAGDWQKAGSDALFEISNLLDGSVVDVHVVGTIMNNIANASRNVTGATAGIIYWLGLDYPATQFTTLGRPTL